MHNIFGRCQPAVSSGVARSPEGRTSGELSETSASILKYNFVQKGEKGRTDDALNNEGRFNLKFITLLQIEAAASGAKELLAEEFPFFSFPRNASKVHPMPP